MSPAGEQHVWVRYQRWWHGCFAGMVILTLVLLAADNAPPNRRLVAAGCILALVGWYAVIGARQINTYGRRRDLLAAAGTIVLVLAGFAAATPVAAMLFIVYPQLFAYLDELRYTLPAVAVLTIGVALVDAARAGWTGAGTLAALGGGAVSLAFAVLIGVWITKIIEQSRDRAGLIEQLEATREALAAAHHEAGVAAERERLAREIHDTLAQGFTSLVMLVQAAEAEVGRSDELVLRHLALAERTARENLAEARSLVAETGPSSLRSASLAEALNRLTERFRDETGVQTRFEIAGTPTRLDGSTEVVALRVVQEALNNVRRHAGAGHVEVRLSYVDDGVEVAVHDDGRGFVPAQAEGFGLRGMRARVGQAGGDVCVDSAPGRGTRLEVSLR